MSIEGQPIKDRRPSFVEQVASLARERYIQGLAGLIWTSNAAYNFFAEGQDFLTSALHGITNPANVSLYSPKFEGVIGKIGALTQEALYFTVIGAAVGVTSVVLDNRNVQREGRGTVTRKGSIILAECNGLPLFVDLAQHLSKGTKLGNVILSKTLESPVLTPEERGLFNVWIANAGGPEKDFFDTRFWKRSGAKNADAIVLNSSDIVASKEAAVVIREQLGNSKALIIVMANNADDLPDKDRDERTGAYIISPYMELARQLARALLSDNPDLLIPTNIDPKIVSPQYRNLLEAKKELLREKMKNLGKGRPIKIFLRGELEGEEGRGLLSAFKKLEAYYTVTSEASDAQVVLDFGSSDLADDSSVLAEVKEDSFRDREDVIIVRTPFDRDNEDNAIGRSDGTISFERATNTRLGQILEPYVKHELYLKDKILRKIKRNPQGA